MTISEASYQWMDEALCGMRSGLDPNLWSEDSKTSRAIAIHICIRHCNVLTACRKYAPPQRGMVVAGIAYTDTYEPVAMKYQPLASPRCTLCA